jgi:TolB-like protein/tetratricopeptide (TPR) repeat protein
VVRAVLGWGILSFAVLQIYEPVMHGLHLPEWTLTLVVVVLGVGFPATFVLAWIFDMGPGGVQRTPSAPGSTPSPARRARTALLLVGLGVLFSVPGWVWYVRHDHARMAAGSSAGGSSTTPAPAGPSVAVLPFVNMSGDPENEYFSDGLSEEILNALAQVPGLRVPARTSSFAFKGKTLDVAKIAEALRVSTLLEGSVRRAGGRVRVTAQLVSSPDGYHLWSQTFDRELKDVFAVQDEIAAAITGALKLQLATSASGGSRKPGSTTNPDAYEAYLKGRQFLAERNRASLEKAMVHLERATKLDPGFAAARADTAIAIVLLGKVNYGDVPTSQAVARARVVLEKATAIAPEHPEVLAAAGLIEANAYQQEAALGFLDRALMANPSNADVQNWRKVVLEALGRYDLVLPAAAAAVQSDPLSRLQLSNYVEELSRFGKDAEAGAIVERLRGLDEGWGSSALGGLAASRGDRAEAIRNWLPALQQGRDIVTLPLALNLSDLGLAEEAQRVAKDEPGVFMIGGDFKRGEALALAATRKTPDDVDAQFDLLLASYGVGRYAEAAGVAARLRPVAFDPAILLVMADAARRAGRAAEAAAYRDDAADRIARMGRAGVSPRVLDFLRGRLAAYDGRDDEAVALLGRTLSATGFGWGRVDLDFPIYARLRQRPDFQAALKRLDGILAAQRKQVVQMLCGPQRLSATWQPAPETCAGLTASP